MKRSKYYFLIFSTYLCLVILLNFTLVGCINLPFGNNKERERSKSIKINAPSVNYENYDSKNIDQGWIHSKNGTTISYLSDCTESNDVSLKQMEITALGGLQNLKIIEQSDLTFAERKALRTHAQGEVDGVIVDVDLLLIKKNGCRYTFTLTGFPQTFSQAKSDFNQFLKGVSIQ